MRRVNVLLVALAVAATLPIAGAEAGVGHRLAPDLGMAAPRHVTLCGLPNDSDVCPDIVSGGTRLLRFSATIQNTGRGPLRIQATRACPDCDTMTTVQGILRSDGTWRTIPSPATVLFETNDDHYHWHVQGMEGYALWPLEASAAEPAVSDKYGFCFFDGRHVRPGMAASPAAPVYRFGDCGIPNSTELDIGLSVGWGDRYGWDFHGQFIDVTTVADGEYLLCLSADATGAYVERNDDNNDSWAEITIAGDAVTVLAKGRTSCSTRLEAIG